MLLKNSVILLFALLTATAQALRSLDSNLSTLPSSCTWDNWTINVCWENPAGFDGERTWVKNTIDNTWRKYSDLQFIGWNACANDSRGIRIKIKDAVPHTRGLGKHILSNRYPPHHTERHGMRLNFEFEHPYFVSCKNNSEYCIKAIAVHEFGHALGFSHEHHALNTIEYRECSIDNYCTDKVCNKVDKSECDEIKKDKSKKGKKCCEMVDCGNKIGISYKQAVQIGEVPITRYDQDSIMNYCNPDWLGGYELSDLDVAGLTLIYSLNKDLIEAATIISDTGDLKVIAFHFLHAVCSGKLGVVKAFLSFKANLNINVQATKGGTALMCAASNGRLDIVKELLKSGAKLDILTTEGGTALMYAAKNGHHEIVKILLGAKKRGCSKRALVKSGVYDKTEEGVTALMFAAASGHLGVVEVLIEFLKESGCKRQVVKKYLNAKNSKGQTALMYASQNGHLEVVEELLKAKGTDYINFKDGAGWTALMYAADRGHFAVVKKLLENNAEPNIKNNIGKTALVYSAMHGNVGIVKELLTNGANLTESAMGFAVIGGHVNVVEEFLKYKGISISDVEYMYQIGLKHLGKLEKDGANKKNTSEFIKVTGVVLKLLPYIQSKKQMKADEL